MISTLIQTAIHAQKTAYAPYSHFLVGAAILTQDGRIFSGANVENASYGLCICAERNAIMQAVLAGIPYFQTLVVATHSSPPAPPCGMCLQVLAEFSQDCQIVLINSIAEEVHTSLNQLLPYRFQGVSLLK